MSADESDLGNPSILNHASIGTNDFDRAVAFYDAVLTTIGAARIMQHGDALAYGKAFPEFWVQRPLNELPATTGNGMHLSFNAASKAEVDAFHTAAVTNGGTCDGPPGPRPIYGEPYYGCFVRDRDGHKIEATYWDMALAEKLGMA